ALVVRAASFWALRWNYPGAAALKRPGPSHAATTLERRTTASVLAAIRAAGRRRLPLRRLARPGRPVVVADAAAGPAGPLWLALQVALGVRGVARIPRAASGACVDWRGGRLPRAAGVLDRRLGAPGGPRRGGR